MLWYSRFKCTVACRGREGWRVDSGAKLKDIFSLPHCQALKVHAYVWWGWGPCFFEVCSLRIRSNYSEFTWRTWTGTFCGGARGQKTRRVEKGFVFIWNLSCRAPRSNFKKNRQDPKFYMATQFCTPVGCGRRHTFCGHSMELCTRKNASKKANFALPSHPSHWESIRGSWCECRGEAKVPT